MSEIGYRQRVEQCAQRLTRHGLHWSAKRSLCPVIREVCADLLEQRIRDGKP